MPIKSQICTALPYVIDHYFKQLPSLEPLIQISNLKHNIFPIWPNKTYVTGQTQKSKKGSYENIP